MHRRAGNVISIGTIAEVDHAAGRVRVDLGGRLSGWLPWPADVGRNYRSWRPLRAGMQVTLAAPSGDPANAQIVQTLYSAALPAPSDSADVDMIHWEDGAVMQHDTAAHHLLFDLRGSNGSLEVRTGTSQLLITPTGIFIRGDVVHLNDDR